MSPPVQTLIDIDNAWRGARVVLLTQHGKELLLQPLLATALGCQVERVTGFDTDRLGTFTREIPREGSQLEAARQKALIGMSLTHSPLGLASEGSFGPDPFTGLMPWNVELVIFIDDLRDLEITGIAAGAARSAHGLVRDEEGLKAFAASAGFPDHHLVLRPDGEDGPVMHKGLDDWAVLVAAFRETLAASRHGQVMVENDLRAHCNPTRQGIIRQACENLIERLHSPCPACGVPGYWKSGLREGLPCAWCRLPTRAPIAERWACGRCAHTGGKALATPPHADPSQCAHCNP